MNNSKNFWLIMPFKSLCGQLVLLRFVECPIDVPWRFYDS